MGGVANPGRNRNRAAPEDRLGVGSVRARVDFSFAAGAQTRIELLAQQGQGSRLNEFPSHSNSEGHTPGAVALSR